MNAKLPRGAVHLGEDMALRATAGYSLAGKLGVRLEFFTLTQFRIGQWRWEAGRDSMAATPDARKLVRRLLGALETADKLRDAPRLRDGGRSR